MKRVARGAQIVAACVSACIAAVVAVPAFGQGAPREGVDYTVVRPSQPTETPAGRVEVVEFFGYWCPACNAFEPALRDWARRNDARIRLLHVPLPTHFQAGQANLQRLYYALEALGIEDALRPRIFAAIHAQRSLPDSADKEAIADWVAKNGVDRARFVAAYDSFGVQSRVRRADQLASAYGVTSTPSLGIGGRFVIPVDARRLPNADLLLARAAAGS